MYVCGRTHAPHGGGGHYSELHYSELQCVHKAPRTTPPYLPNATHDATLRCATLRYAARRRLLFVARSCSSALVAAAAAPVELVGPLRRALLALPRRRLALRAHMRAKRMGKAMRRGRASRSAWNGYLPRLCH